jgi:uncharacterized membrane protein
MRQQSNTAEPAPGLERTVEENVHAIKAWERALRGSRSRPERVVDAITQWAAGGPALLLHLSWFAGWILVNTGLVSGVAPFDPFPFPFLTFIVSLEAIVLTLLVLGSQNRMGGLSEKRNHLDLQIDLLAEREMTTVLQLLQDIATHLKAQTHVTPDVLRDLAKKTDLPYLEQRMDELAEPEKARE